MAQFVTTSVDDEVCSLAASGEVDIATVEAFLDAAGTCLGSGAATIEIDLGGVTFLDSSGLGALVRLRNESGEAGKSLVLVNVPAAVGRLFEVTGLAEVFTTRTDG